MDRKSRDEFIKKIWEMVEPVVVAEGVELLEVEFQREPVGYVLRLYIDHPDGVTIDDCARISSVVGDFLDVTDPIDHSYNLEVSSPGLDRPLRKVEHFMAHKGSIVKIKTVEPIENRKSFKGSLIGVTEGRVEMECDGVIFKIPLEAIEKARLMYFDTQRLSKTPGRIRRK
ncbi:MAG: ribosome maturation factor RimP [Deltaproteobacteria bacterium]|nr:ribosome maturation factor RimP [Deltaproteobacteria bacterium]MBW2068369.1 ribosome maturation factor RimP [Deltaproteobacteria bacterium]